MNKLSRIPALLLFLFYSLFSTAQTKHNILKYSTLSFAAYKAELSYERTFQNGLNLELDFGLIAHKDNEHEEQLGTALLEDYNSFVISIKREAGTFVSVHGAKRGFFAELGPKFYLRNFEKDNLAGGFYLKPELTFMQYDFKQYRMERVRADGGVLETTTLENLTMTNIGGKLNMGVQWLIHDIVAIDLFTYVGGQSRSIQPESGVKYSNEDAMYKVVGEEADDLFDFYDFLTATYGPIPFGMGVKIGLMF